MSDLFSVNQSEELEQAVRDALDQVEKKFGVTFNFKKKRRVKSKTFTLNIEAVKSTNECNVDYLSKDYVDHCENFNLKRSWLWKEFILDDKFYKIIGLIKNNKENPLVVLTEDNERNKMPHTYAIEYFLANPVKPNLTVICSNN